MSGKHDLFMNMVSSGRLAGKRNLCCLGAAAGVRGGISWAASRGGSAEILLVEVRPPPGEELRGSLKSDLGLLSGGRLWDSSQGRCQRIPLGPVSRRRSVSPHPPAFQFRSVLRLSRGPFRWRYPFLTF